MSFADPFRPVDGLREGLLRDNSFFVGPACGPCVECLCIGVRRASSTSRISRSAWWVSSSSSVKRSGPFGQIDLFGEGCTLLYGTVLCAEFE
jgi:hypothetical protein